MRNQHIKKKTSKSENEPQIGIVMHTIVLFPYTIGCEAALKGPYSCIEDAYGVSSPHPQTLPKESAGTVRASSPWQALGRSPSSRELDLLRSGSRQKQKPRQVEFTAELTAARVPCLRCSYRKCVKNRTECWPVFGTVPPIFVPNKCKKQDDMLALFCPKK